MHRADGYQRQRLASRPLSLDPVFSISQHVVYLCKNNAHCTRGPEEQATLMYDKGLRERKLIFIEHLCMYYYSVHLSPKRLPPSLKEK